MPIGKLGKLAPKPNPRTLSLKSYLKAGVVVPAPSPKRAWEYKIPDAEWASTMYGNDTIGDCTCAAAGHILMAVTSQTGKALIPTLDEIVGMYSAVTGYDPKQTDETGYNPTDNGAAMTDVLDWLLKNGLAGRKILGWVQIDHTSLTHFEQCVELFGACDVGVQLPQSALDQAQASQNWNVVNPDGGIVGGHAIPYLGYGRLGATCITWGQRQPTGTSWLQKYCDEAYGIIWDDWFDVNTGLSPTSFDKNALLADLKALAV